MEGEKKKSAEQLMLEHPARDGEWERVVGGELGCGKRSVLTWGGGQEERTSLGVIRVGSQQCVQGWEHLGKGEMRMFVKGWR